ncbi:sce7725 family protein [Labilibaculum euxinus]|uniref:Sce7725 family protein n=1 Tax=Labilibaculum euxinus TaxID=2686357 RepID=A0A7M4D509_9BACT|nr:sce7725 family protein [Labilibaculum euxinus]MUP37738.1 sce7725 family protein [Labilibaculum euxinus]MVB06943.1 sce7725 family protein [Labilibaculum euxinus]
MYYPYLRGRQFELIALREYAHQKGDNNKVIPIIEPVKSTFNSMKLAIPKLNSGNVRFALILNPQDGDCKNPEIILQNLSRELEDRSTWIPTFILTNNLKEVSELLTRYSFMEVMVICSDLVDTSTKEFNNLVLSASIKYIVTKENRTLKRALRGQNKNLIRLDDKFEAQSRNSDYLSIPEQKFTEEHTFFPEDGYNGFSDYTVIASEFKEGGSTPYAVAIHLTYQKDNNEIWIRHFTSESNFGRENIQGKFEEAARKAVIFINENNINTHAAKELIEYYNLQKYPGLGMVKKISIKHHLELINNIL